MDFNAYTDIENIKLKCEGKTYMNYDVQGIAQLYLTTATDLTANEFENKFHEDNIIKASLKVTLSNGSTKEIDVMEFLKLQWNSFIEKENH